MRMISFAGVMLLRYKAEYRSSGGNNAGNRNRELVVAHISHTGTRTAFGFPEE